MDKAKAIGLFRMRVTGCPKWVEDTVAEAVEWWNSTHGTNYQAPKIEWCGNSEHPDPISLGLCMFGGVKTIRIWTRDNLPDQKLTLLHELAHWLNPSIRGHKESFWVALAPLCLHFGLPLDVCKTLEKLAEGLKRGKSTDARGTYDCGIR